MNRAADPTALRVDLDAEKARLKRFQRATVDTVYRRLYEDDPPANRFLVADEVGLGKTLVARGLMARIVDRLRDKPSINVVYICSNRDIARQNLRRMQLGDQQEAQLPDRLTLLPRHMGDLTQNRLNIIAFTPGTSFNLKSRTGRKEERILLYWMLKGPWRLAPLKRRPLNALAVTADPQGFRIDADHFLDVYSIDPALKREFVQALRDDAAIARQEGRPTLSRRFKAVCRKLPRGRDWLTIDAPIRDEIQDIVGQLRLILAESCVRMLKPDLVVLDEFQRFRDLLTGTDDGAMLARQLFDWRDAKVLLLSATPYKMYTHAGEDDEDHHSDFVKTMRFLIPDDAEADRLDRLLSSYRDRVLRLGEPDAESALLATKTEIEQLLRSVMVRTERLAVTRDRDGMLRERVATVPPLPQDVRGYLQMHALSRWMADDNAERLGDPVEYWKSAPYLLSFMEHYKLKHMFEASTQTTRRGSRRAAELAKLVAGADQCIMPWRQYNGYERVDAGNPRMRSLMHETLDHAGAEIWRLLWLPPTAPHYALQAPFDKPELGGFTKRLIFAGWRVVPKSIAVLLSYEAERRMMQSDDPDAVNSPEYREKRGGLLDFAVDRSSAQERLTGMPVLALLYPSFWLAENLDPLAFAHRSQTRGARLTLDQLRQQMRAAVSEALKPLEELVSEAVRPDESWYWAAPILLDRLADDEAACAWWDRTDLADVWRGHEESGAWGQHVELAYSRFLGDGTLGPMPPDLPDVLTDLALAGPAVAALRAIGRVTGPDALSDPDVRDYAGHVAESIRTLWNTPEATAVIRAGAKGGTRYWRRALDYGARGGLQAVLDEYAHLLRESEGVQTATPQEQAEAIVAVMAQVIGLRAGQPRVDRIKRDGHRKVELEPRIARSRFATSFGDDASEEESVQRRRVAVRQAFNSPFWPFVLATTSIGQEGLDFHPYCHAVVHWNLPTNPVDLEQREGRVHRYKGHAVRKNVARRHLEQAMRSAESGDVWERLFEIAHRDAGEDTQDLSPYWVYPDPEGAAIERIVPVLPLSRDEQAIAPLKSALTIYRMVFGQPRQDDLIAYLRDRLPAEQREDLVDRLRIDLTPQAHASIDPVG